MTRFLAQLLCGLFALLITGIVVMLVLANRAPVSISTTPLPYQLEMPLYLIMALCFLAGLMLGLWLYIGLKLKTGFIIRKQRRQLATAPKP